MPHRLSSHAAIDSLSNLAASLNAGKDKQAGDAFFVPLLARDQIESLYRGDWLARKIVDIVPYDAVREWREWAGDPADVTRIETLERGLNLRRAVQRAMVMGRLYGGGALIIGTRESDPAALATELRPEGIGPGGLTFLHAVSRWQLAVAETERDPLSSWYGEPKAYDVTAPERGALTLHPSRVIRFLGNPLADPSLFGADLWSDSVLTTLYDAIHAVALTTTGATSLMHEAKVDVVTVPNLSEHLSNAATTAQLSARFSYAATMKSLNNLLLLGDGETWTRQKIDFAGLPEMVRTFLQVAAGAADIPVTRLLGQSPAGLSATGDSDTRNYYDMIAARQEIELRPQLERLDRLLLASAGVAPGALRFSFRPLWQMDAAAQAAVALSRAQATQIYAGLGLWPTEVMAGLVRGQLAEDGIYPNAGAVFEATETDGPEQPLWDYSPDQPRDPQGRWSEGGGGATSGHPGDPSPETIQADPPHSLTIHPKAGRSSSETAWPQQSGTANGLLGLIGNALSALNPISTAYAQESNLSKLSGETTSVELLNSSKRGWARTIVGLFIGAVRFARWLGEYFGGDDPDSPNPVDHPKGEDDEPSIPPSSGSPKKPTKFTPQENAGLRELFKGGGEDLSDKGAQALLDQLSKGPVKLPPNVTSEVLERYAKVAQYAIDEGIDKKGVQAMRLEPFPDTLTRGSTM